MRGHHLRRWLIISAGAEEVLFSNHKHVLTNLGINKPACSWSLNYDPRRKVAFCTKKDLSVVVLSLLVQCWAMNRKKSGERGSKNAADLSFCMAQTHLSLLRWKWIDWLSELDSSQLNSALVIGSFRLDNFSNSQTGWKRNSSLNFRIESYIRLHMLEF